MELFNLTDEEVWLKCMLALLSNPAILNTTMEYHAKTGDIFLQEFKNRFRDGE